MRDDAIESYMTPNVHTIGVRRTLAEARDMMRELKVRHLPVMKGGELVGLLSDRELALVESLPGVNPKKVTVDEAMSQDVFVVSRDAPLALVARRMAQRRLGSAVVVERGEVVGIFTAVDALNALDFLLTSPLVRQALHGALVPADRATRRS
jgi:acetoin utilization protein AcuB